MPVTLSCVRMLMHGYLSGRLQSDDASEPVLRHALGTETTQAQVMSAQAACLAAAEVIS